jgi:predicted exporter
MRRAVLTKHASTRGWRWLAWLWLAVVLALGVHQLRFWSESRLESDIMALLPQDAHDPVLAEATRKIADAGARQMVVLLGARDASKAQAAAQAYRARLQQAEQQQALPFAEDQTMRGWFAEARTFYLPWRDRLLTGEQRERLQQQSADSLANDALSALYGPMGAPRLTDWRADPLNLWAGWWQARAAGAGLRFDADGLLHADDRVWAVLQLQTRGSAFRLDGQRVIDDALDAAANAARHAVPDVRELRAGVPLHAEAAAVQASYEVNVIGWGSLAAVLLLVWWAFRSLRPILLVALSLLIGVAAALSVTAMVFGKVHLLTMVFGASLVGVAEDYGIHWFASRQGHPQQERFTLLRALLPGMSLAWLTSALAYLALGLAPFPGLRQMAVFSVVGLAGAFLTVICWFPWLERGAPPATSLSRAMHGWLQRWPRVRTNKTWAALAAVTAVVIVSGLWQVRAQDDLRSLQASPKALIAQQIEVGRLLGLPSPAQFYLVRAPDPDTLLQREQALTARLAVLTTQGKIKGYRAISDWLPSPQQQAADAARTAHVETAVLARLSVATGEQLQRPAFSTQPLRLQAWLAAPASRPLRQLWLGKLGNGVGSVVLVDVAGNYAILDTLHHTAEGLAGVRWVNRTAEFSALLGHYRQMMLWLLLAGTLLVILALWWRYRGDAWRTLLPTLLAGGLCVAMLGWLGMPLQLFNVLALLLLLGMGVDYGIFLLEHRGDASAWLAVCVGAASTWLSFGLLGLSATPALRAFGLTLLMGIGLVWLLSPLFRPTHRPCENTVVENPPIETPTSEVTT